MTTNLLDRIAETEPVSIPDTEKEVLDARGFDSLAIVTDSGATATISRVDSLTADAHHGGPRMEPSVPPNSRGTIRVEWSFYLVSSAGGISTACLS